MEYTNEQNPWYNHVWATAYGGFLDLHWYYKDQYEEWEKKNSEKNLDN